MAWDVFNVLKVGARPVWLVRVIVAGNTYYHTTGSIPVSTPAGSPDATFLDTTLWTPLAIYMEHLVKTANTKKATTTVDFPSTSDIGQAFINSPSAWRGTVTIWQGFHGDADNEYVPVFDGQAVQLKPSRTKVGVVLLDQTITMVNKGLDRVLQAPCQYMLFGAGCNLDPAPFTVVAEVSVIDGNTLTIVDAATYPDGYFNWGRVIYNGDEQTIAEHVGNSVRLTGPFYELQAAVLPVNVSLLPGCAKNLTNCNFFDNVPNFGGFPQLLDTPYDEKGVT